MSELCTDNRFELIEKYKQKLIEGTNIEMAPDEMAVIDDILFRFWQMGWLDNLDADAVQVVRCEYCKYRHNSLLCSMYSEGMDTPEDWFCADGKWRDDPSHPFADDVMMGE